MEHRINERYTYTVSHDLQGRPYYDLWDNNRMHGLGSMRGPVCAATSYNLSKIKSIANN